MPEDWYNLTVTITDTQRNVGIYCRISDDREGRGEGVDRQQEACKTLIKNRKWRLVDVYTDNDISATQTKKPRPSYLRLMEDLRSGRINTVVVWAIDRLYRRPIELEDLLDLIDVQPDITVTAVQGSNLRLETSDGQVMARVMVALAKRETDLLKARIRSKHEDLANLGKPHGGARAFGYNSGQLTINQEEAEIVRKMVKMFLASQNSSEIVRWLHKNGIKTARGGEWGRKAVTDLLRNPRHAGYRSHKGTLTKAVACRLTASSAAVMVASELVGVSSSWLLVLGFMSHRMRVGKNGAVAQTRPKYAYSPLFFIGGHLKHFLGKYDPGPYSRVRNRAMCKRYESTTSCQGFWGGPRNGAGLDARSE